MPGLKPRVSDAEILAVNKLPYSAGAKAAVVGLSLTQFQRRITKLVKPSQRALNIKAGMKASREAGGTAGRPQEISDDEIRRTLHMTSTEAANELQINRNYLTVRRRQLAHSDPTIGHCQPTDPSIEGRALLRRSQEYMTAFWEPGRKLWRVGLNSKTPVEMWAAGWRYVRPTRPWEEYNKRYQEPCYPQYNCNHCGKLFRGPTVFCSLACAAEWVEPVALDVAHGDTLHRPHLGQVDAT